MADTAPWGDRNGRGAVVFVSLLLGFATLAVAFGADAQFGGGMGRGPGGMGNDGGSMGGGQRRGPDGQGNRSTPPPGAAGSAELQVQITRLHDDLKLDADQQRLFDVYVTRLLRFADDTERNQSALRMLAGSELDSPKQFEKLVDVERNRLTALEDVAEAAAKLHAGLSPSQRALANQRLATAAVELVANVRARAADDGARQGGAGGMR